MWIISTSCFLPYEKILILAETIASWRSAPMRNSIVHAIFTRNFPKMTLFQTSKSILSNPFWAIIPKNFRICSRHVSGDNNANEFWFMPLKPNHGILKFSGLKTFKKHIQDFKNSIIPLQGLIKIMSHRFLHLHA